MSLHRFFAGLMVSVSFTSFHCAVAADLSSVSSATTAGKVELGDPRLTSGIPGYKKQFDVIFEDGVTIDNVGKALATFERVLVTGPTPYDYENDLRNF